MVVFSTFTSRSGNQFFDVKLKVSESKTVTVRILKQANQTITEAYLKSLRQKGEPVKLKSLSKTQNEMFFFNTSRGSTIERTNLFVPIMSSRRLQDVLKDLKLLR